MKKYFTLFFLTCGIILQAQQTLPYITYFDTPAEQAGWTEYRLKSTAYYNWSFGGNQLSHDYPVGSTGTDTTYDWMVSPALDLSNGGKIDLSVSGYIIANLTPEDYFGIWVSTGSPDPANGDYTEVADLTDFSLGGTFKDTAAIDLGTIAPNAYVAFVYQATWNWYTIAIDSVAVNPAGTIGTKEVTTRSEIQLYPLPADSYLRINLPEGKKDASYFISDLSGKVLKSGLLEDYQSKLDISLLNKGSYLLTLQYPQEVISLPWSKN